MSFSLLVSQHHPKSPDRVEAWETAFLELQVVLAYIDSVLAPAERMTLSLLNLAKWDEKDNRRQVDELTRSIEKHGIDQAVRRVIRKLEELFEQEDPTIRPHLAQEILQSSVAIVVADDVISDNEESFLRDLLAPALGMDEAHVMEVVKAASGRLSRFRAYAERGLECYLMLAELQEGPPQLNSLAGDKLPGFLGAVDQWVVLLDRQLRTAPFRDDTTGGCGAHAQPTSRTGSTVTRHPSRTHATQKSRRRCQRTSRYRAPCHQCSFSNG